MGKALIGFGLATTFGAVFMLGMATTILIYGRNPELGHYQIDRMHEAIENAKKA
jgi:hypothetical protein